MTEVFEAAKKIVVDRQDPTDGYMLTTTYDANGLWLIYVDGKRIAKGHRSMTWFNFELTTIEVHMLYKATRIRSE